MAEVKTTLNILIDSLQQKKKALIKIEALSKEQEKILKAEKFDNKNFSRTINNKQVQIDKVVTIDNGFKGEFNKISGRLEANSSLYQKEITEMKRLIKEIGELEVSVQVLERRNKTHFEIISNKEKDKVKTFKKSKQAASNYYSSMNKQKQTDNSYFFDSKK